MANVNAAPQHRVAPSARSVPRQRRRTDQVRIHTSTYITYIQTNMRMYRQAFIHTNTHPHPHTHTHKVPCIHTFWYAYIHTYINTYIPTYVHTGMHAYIHTYKMTCSKHHSKGLVASSSYSYACGTVQGTDGRSLSAIRMPL